MEEAGLFVADELAARIGHGPMLVEPALQRNQGKACSAVGDFLQIVGVLNSVLNSGAEFAMDRFELLVAGNVAAGEGYTPIPPPCRDKEILGLSCWAVRDVLQVNSRCQDHPRSLSLTNLTIHFSLQYVQG